MAVEAFEDQVAYEAKIGSRFSYVLINNEISLFVRHPYLGTI